MRKGSNGRIQVAETRLNLREGSLTERFCDSVIRQFCYGPVRLIERVSLVAKTGVSDCEVEGHYNIEPDVEFAEGLSV
jgi:hypothetical protein